MGRRSAATDGDGWTWVFRNNNNPKGKPIDNPFPKNDTKRSKEDDVQQISTSVFVTNFPDKFGAKDLWYSCKTYGHVVDAYIPDRRSKVGKRFGFVRFIKVLDVECLVNNLCTVWNGRYKLHANVARFQREPVNKHNNKVNENGTSRNNGGSRMSEVGAKGTTNSYSQVVKGYRGQKDVGDDIPTMVLDETCLNKEDYSLCLLGKVKEFASLTNLKVVLAKEGYANIELRYMGGFWVMIVFQDDETMNRFHSNLAAGSWFSQIIQAHNEFTIEERVTWVEIEGIPCKWWSRNTFNRIASRWGRMLNGEELEEGNFHSNRICISTKIKTALFESFRMVYRGNVCWVRAIEVPGWVPDFEEDCDGESIEGSQEDEVQGDSSRSINEVGGESDMEAVPETSFEVEPNNDIVEHNSPGHSKTQSGDPFGIYDVLKKKRDVCNNDSIPEVSLKYPPGFTPNEEGDTAVEGPDILLKENRTSYDQEGGGYGEKQSHERNEFLNDAQESYCSGHFKKSPSPEAEESRSSSSESVKIFEPEESSQGRKRGRVSGDDGASSPKRRRRIVDGEPSSLDVSATAADMDLSDTSLPNVEPTEPTGDAVHVEEPSQKSAEAEPKALDQLMKELELAAAHQATLIAQLYYTRI
ncbi:nucleotide-binding alpha-beta plait domain-containing protein [Artemisia annua]|uniref:Nucleotide-binding alpha-beta plait domain-containing protein n=1 Tax=Artemisia annua TaxID=35608 RepID=A0A2U1MD90_ARTAN|nr:nucleotide-binding alpha-beta plait domain-containing protein [Artemisia annua]